VRASADDLQRSAPRPIPLRGYAAVGVAAAALALIVHYAGALNGAERTTVDTRFGLRGPQPRDGRIVIVSLDPKSLRAFNVQMPIPRVKYAQLLDRVRGARPRLIAVDVQFTGAAQDTEGDRALVASVARNGPVLLATHDTRDGPIPVPAGRSNAAGSVLGSVGTQNDPDGVVRRMLYAPVALRSFPVRAAEMYSGAPVSERDFPDNSAWIAFRGPPGTFPAYSFVDVLDGRVPAGRLAGKAVLIGITDPAAKDVFVTSASDKPMSGVEVHANALSTILEGFPLQPAPDAVAVLLILLLAALPVAIGAHFNALHMLAACIGVFGLLIVAAQLTFNAGWIVPVLGPTLALALSAAAATGVQALLERRQRRSLEAALGRLLPPKSPRPFFISYRRDQSAWPARILRDELAKRFGAESVFMDTASLQAGERWPRRIDEAARGCGVMLALFGPQWLEARTDDGRRRIDDPADWVRREIETVLARPDALLVPVLLDGATIPAAAALPKSLRQLADHQAVVLTADRLSADIDELLDSIEQGRLRDLASKSQVVPGLADEEDVLDEARSRGRRFVRASSSGTATASDAHEGSKRSESGRGA
jgi:CHASE2 domain-containing sensor protein